MRRKFGKNICNVQDSAWQWLNGVNLSESLMERFGMEKARSDSYRRCAYLNLRDNGEVKIEATNCGDEKHPFICKYGES